MNTIKLKLSHDELKLQALTNSERESRRQRDSLQLKLAAAEQDKLVMEIRMREMVGFQNALRGGDSEYSNGDSSLLDRVRGKLLTVANQKVINDQYLTFIASINRLST